MEGPNKLERRRKQAMEKEVRKKGTKEGRNGGNEMKKVRKKDNEGWE